MWVAVIKLDRIVRRIDFKAGSFEEAMDTIKNVHGDVEVLSVTREFIGGAL